MDNQGKANTHVGLLVLTLVLYNIIGFWIVTVLLGVILNGILRIAMESSVGFGMLLALLVNIPIVLIWRKMTKEARQIKKRQKNGTYNTTAGQKFSGNVTPTQQKTAQNIDPQSIQGRTLSYAPEIYDDVKRSIDFNRRIIEFLNNSALANKQELLATQNVNFDRYKSIVEGYLTMKKAPDDFANLADKLTEAKQTISTYDDYLEELYTKYNNDNLHDFEVSIRLMKENTGAKGE